MIFFADIDAPFTVKVAGEYTFYVASDDGFVLSVDKKQLCEWTHDRPLTTNFCKVHLTEGSHQFKLSYFQGYGNAGLTMAYSHGNDSRQYMMGANSKYIRFLIFIPIACLHKIKNTVPPIKQYSLSLISANTCRICS